jgi:hypothetical protein
MNFSMRSTELSILCLKIQYKSQGKRMLADNAQAINNVTYSTYSTGTAEWESILIFSLMLLRHNEGMHAPMQVPCVDVSDTVVRLDGCARAQ